jgi:hypothetical protein
MDCLRSSQVTPDCFVLRNSVSDFIQSNADVKLYFTACQEQTGLSGFVANELSAFSVH